MNRTMLLLPVLAAAMTACSPMIPVTCTTAPASPASSAASTHSAGQPPTPRAPLTVDYRVTRHEANAPVVLAGRVHTLVDTVWDVDVGAPRSSPGERIRLKAMVRDDGGGKYRVELEYDEATSDGGRFRVSTAMIVKPGEPAVTKLDAAGGTGRDVTLTLQ